MKSKEEQVFVRVYMCGSSFLPFLPPFMQPGICCTVNSTENRLRRYIYLLMRNAIMLGESILRVILSGNN